MQSDYSAAYQQLTRLYQHRLCPIIYRRLQHMYKLAAEEALSLHVHHLECFAFMLEQIPEWNNSMVKEETDKIRQQCPGLESTVKGMWGSLLKVIGSSRIDVSGEPIHAKVPEFEQVVHQIYIWCSRWLQPELFDHAVNAHRRSKNQHQARKIIMESVPGAFTELLPLNNIFEAYARDSTTAFTPAPPPAAAETPPTPPAKPAPQAPEAAALEDEGIDPDATTSANDLPKLKEAAEKYKAAHSAAGSEESEPEEEEAESQQLPDEPPEGFDSEEDEADF